MICEPGRKDHNGFQGVALKFTRWLFIPLAVSIVNADGTDIAGTWRATVVGGLRTKTIGQALLEIRVDGDRLTGTAHIGNEDKSYYPGAAPISDGKIDGDQISFTVVGEHSASTGIPIMKFVGAIHGDELELTMTLSDNHVWGTMKMRGERVSK